MNNLLRNVKLTRISADGAGSASSTPNKMTIIDMLGYESVLFFAAMGNVLTTSVVSLKVAGATTNSSGAMTVLTGSAGGTADATSYDDKIVALDVVKPGYRYLECQLTCATADAPYDGVFAIQYNGHDLPVTQGSTVVASNTLYSPAP